MNTLTSVHLQTWKPMEQSLLVRPTPGYRHGSVVAYGCSHNWASKKSKLNFPSQFRGSHRRLQYGITSQGGNGALASQFSQSRASHETRHMSFDHLLEPVKQDLESHNKKIKKVSGEENPVLMAAADQIFGGSGKTMRPAIVFLASRATAQLTGLGDIVSQHYLLAEITELIHAASFVHDDVLDESDSCKSSETANRPFGTRVAVLAGDYIFAQTTWLLANLENVEVIKLISQVVKDFSSGEIMQATTLYDCEVSLEDYLQRIYCKTASLIAASTKAAAIFSGASVEVKEKMYDYGKNVGLAFQIVNDILDFTQSDAQSSKLRGSDLNKGNLTVPVIYALETEPGLRDLIQTKFVNAGDLEKAIKMVQNSGGIEKAHSLAREKGKRALDCLKCLPKGVMRSSLEGMVDYALDYS